MEAVSHVSFTLIKKLVFRKRIICLFLGFIFSLHNAFASEYCHYVNGLEGIKAATLPPPGSYYRMYHVFYHANDFKDSNGKKLALDYKLTAYAQVHRFARVTDKKFLGANFAFGGVIYFLYQKLRIGALGVNDSSSGLGDIFLEPVVLGWHKKQYDFAFGIGGFFPSGKYDVNKPASPGKDTWTGMFTLGGTYYFDEKKSYSASILGRFEMHTEEDKTNVKAGNDFHFEWGIGKTIHSKWIWDVGVSGYCHWQVTDDRGTAVLRPGDHDRVFGVGPEVIFTIPSSRLSVSLRNNWEFEAKDRPEGYISVITITKRF